MIDINTIPKDLPLTNPLDFIFLISILATKKPINFDGYSQTFGDLKTPAFSYSVNSQSIIQEQTQSGVNQSFLEMKIVAIIWDMKPIYKSLWRVWDKLPSGTALGRKVDMSWKYDFEKWKNSTRDMLYHIIHAATMKTGKRKFSDPPSIRNRKLLSDIYGIELGENIIFKYAEKENASDIHGVAAFFEFKMPYSKCCIIPESILKQDGSLTKDYMESVGFQFGDLC